MAEQVDKLNQRKAGKPLSIRKVRYIGIRKIVERPEPFKIDTYETYYPYLGEGGDRDPLRRTATRRKAIDIVVPATHEVHLACPTVTESIDVIGHYNMKIAAVVNVYGDTRHILNNRPSGSGVYIHGEGEEEATYFVLTWRQVLPVPDYRERGSSRRLRERMRYPTENFSRMEDNAKVYYLQKASPEEFQAIITAFKSTQCEKS